MSDKDVHSQQTVQPILPPNQQQSAAVTETQSKDRANTSETDETVFDVVDEASWESFPASDVPGWMPSHIGAKDLRGSPHGTDSQKGSTT